MKYRISYRPDYWKKPANRLVAVLQDKCKELLADPEREGISSLYILEERLWEFVQEVKSNYPRCSPGDLKTRVLDFKEDSFQAFSLIHKRDNIAESIDLNLYYAEPFPSGSEGVSGFCGTIAIDYTI